jgi:hypothetical protein
MSAPEKPVARPFLLGSDNAFLTPEIQKNGGEPMPSAAGDRSFPVSRPFSLKMPAVFHIMAG